MATHESIEMLLRIPRLVSTMSAARSFDGPAGPSTSTTGDHQFQMRSAMDLHPGVGKWVSRRVVRQRDSSAGVIADPSASRFIDHPEIDRAVAGVRRDGFYVFERIVDASITEAIRTFAEQAPATARGAGTAPEPYPRSAPAVGRYDIDEETALGCPEVQEFATDPAMATIAQRYLGQPVLMDEVAFWWTTTQRAEDADVNAQLFHQDRDRLSFLKFFIYLTDVTPETGPHVYLRGSHRNIPWSLRGDGRKTDEAVRSAGLWDHVTELCGPAGTIMAVDTIGLHKGKTPISGDRLALENEFATSLFGMDYERPQFAPTDLVIERFAAMPWVLQRYADAVRTSSPRP
jgi:Phytanoyl-CoA dioxygenase (PhyH)